MNNKNIEAGLTIIKWIVNIVVILTLSALIWFSQWQLLAFILYCASIYALFLIAYNVVTFKSAVRKFRAGVYSGSDSDEQRMLDLLEKLGKFCRGNKIVDDVHP